MLRDFEDMDVRSGMGVEEELHSTYRAEASLRQLSRCDPLAPFSIERQSLVWFVVSFTVDVSGFGGRS
jgi:hypothetical protein